MNEPLTLTVREEQLQSGVPFSRFLTVAGGFRDVTREINNVINLEHEEPARAELVVVAARPGSIEMDLEMREVGVAPYDVARAVMNATVNGLELLERERIHLDSIFASSIGRFENTGFEPRVYDVPQDIDQEIAKLKLRSMGVRLDVLTAEQTKYLNSWNEGT